MNKRCHLSFILGIIAIVMGIFLLKSSCSNNIDMQDNKSDKTFNVQIIFKSCSDTCFFWQMVEEGINTAASEFKINYEITAPPSENCIDLQIELMENAIKKNPDAIILAAADYEELVPVCKKAYEKKIPLITLDSDVNFDGVSAFIGTDNYEIGKKLSELVNAMLNPDDKFGIIGYVATTSTEIEREQGLIDNIKNTQNRICSFKYCNGSIKAAQQLTAQMIKENPEIKCIVGLNEISSIGAAIAIEKLNSKEDIILICTDSSKKQIEFMEKGIIKAFVAQNPFNMGYFAVKNTIDILNGESVCEKLYTDSIIIKKEDLFKAESQKILFPFNTDNN